MPGARYCVSAYLSDIDLKSHRASSFDMMSEQRVPEPHHLERADWQRHKPGCQQTTASWKAHAEVTAIDRASGLAMSIPMENINPLLQEFVISYRALLNFAMFNAFGWTAPHLPHTPDGPGCFCEVRPGSKAESRILFITLQAVTNLSLSTKGRAAFLVDDAEALTIDAFRQASSNPGHRLYHRVDIEYLDPFEQEIEQFDNSPGAIQPRHSMCFMKLDFSNGVRRSIVLKSFHTRDHPLNDYALGWCRADWLEYLKQEVAKGKGWKPRGEMNPYVFQ
ncbi:hypothetical protein HWV62_5486 [Athelia sp. TMB]|nr:hypothetical protein HWV62_5486 [Athelia sp. TMB]